MLNNSVHGLVESYLSQALQFSRLQMLERWILFRSNFYEH